MPTIDGAATGVDLRETAALDRIAASFLRWRTEGATDVGIQTSQVLGAVRDHPERRLTGARRLEPYAGGSGPTREAPDRHEREGRAGGDA